MSQTQQNARAVSPTGCEDDTIRTGRVVVARGRSVDLSIRHDRELHASKAILSVRSGEGVGRCGSNLIPRSTATAPELETFVTMDSMPSVDT